jgi:hypothetical protein
MPVITYFAVLSFSRTEDGDFRAEAAIEVRSSEQAKAMAARREGPERDAVAFSKTGDPQLGEWQDAAILGRYGDVPDDLALERPNPARALIGGEASAGPLRTASAKFARGSTWLHPSAFAIISARQRSRSALVILICLPMRRKRGASPLSRKPSKVRREMPSDSQKSSTESRRSGSSVGCGFARDFGGSRRRGWRFAREDLAMDLLRGLADAGETSGNLASARDRSQHQRCLRLSAVLSILHPFDHDAQGAAGRLADTQAATFSGSRIEPLAPFDWPFDGGC